MSQENEVLLAIMNVKKYAKNLKKKASNLHDPIEQIHFIQAVSSPSFFQPHLYRQMGQLNSPTLFTKSSYNQSFEAFPRKKKCKKQIKNVEHSMTNIPGFKQMQRGSRKNSNVQITSPSKTVFTSSNTKFNLNQSSKIQINKLNNQTVEKKQKQKQKQKKQTSKSEIKMQLKKNERKQQYLSLNMQQRKYGNGEMDGVNRVQQKKHRNIDEQDPKIIQQLVKQIQNLKQEIYGYKKALIIIKCKYLQMQQKCKQKIECDHLLDILKQKIQILEKQKQSLHQNIQKQNQKIIKFQTTIIQVAQKFLNHFQNYINQLIQLSTQNLLYHQLLFLKAPIISTYPTKTQSIDIKSLTYPSQKHTIKQSNHTDNNGCHNGSQSQSQSDVQSEGYNKPLTLCTKQICKTSKDIQTKYCRQIAQEK